MIMKYDIENCERFTDSLTDFGLPFLEWLSQLEKC